VDDDVIVFLSRIFPLRGDEQAVRFATLSDWQAEHGEAVMACNEQYVRIASLSTSESEYCGRRGDALPSLGAKESDVLSDVLSDGYYLLVAAALCGT
jgi:hypothetical protein